MNCPKVKSVKPVGKRILMVTFDNHQVRRYDISPLLAREMFAPLKNPALFRAARVDPGGYAVVWNDRIDISEHELWTHGQAVSGSASG